jgi:ribosomal protein S13
MSHPFVLNLIPTTHAANDDAPSRASALLDPREERVLALHKAGVSRRKIVEATGETEHYVRRITKGVPVTEKLPTTPSERAVARSYPMAIGRTGIKDYQLRSVMNECYGVEWDAEKGRYKGRYTVDQLKRVKERIRERATAEGHSAIFVMDWINADAPLESNTRITQCASNLQDAIQEAVDEFMQTSGIQQVEEGLDLTLARKKQEFAARRHILKLAVKGFSKEPIARLQERTLDQVNQLAGTPDAPGVSVSVTQLHHPEPKGNDAFLDYCEGQGWLHPDHYPEVKHAISAAGY